MYGQRAGGVDHALCPLAACPWERIRPCLAGSEMGLMLFHPHTCKPRVLLGWNERRNRVKALWPGVSARKTVSDSEKMGWEEVGRWMWMFPHCWPCRGAGRHRQLCCSCLLCHQCGHRGWFTLQGHTQTCTGLTAPVAKTCLLTSAWTQACFSSRWEQ